MKRLIKSPLFNVVLLLTNGALVLYFSLNEDFEGIVTQLRSANVQWAYFCIALILLYYYLGGYLFKLYSNLFISSFTTTRGFILALIGAFGSAITPSASGGQIFQVTPFKKYGLKTSQTASILYLDFIIYQCTMIGFVSLLFILKFSDYFKNGSPVFYVVLAGFLVNVVLMAALILLYKSKKFHYIVVNSVIKFLHKIKIIKDPQKSIDKINNQVDYFHESSKLIENNKKLLVKAVLINVMRFIVYYSIPYFVILTLNIELDASRIVDVICLTAFVSMVNAFIPVPGASGGTEITFVTVFAPLMGSGILSVMLIWRFITFYFVLVLGGLVLFFTRRYQIQRLES